MASAMRVCEKSHRISLKQKANQKVDDQLFAASVRSMFETDIEESVEIEWKQWRRRWIGRLASTYGAGGPVAGEPRAAAGEVEVVQAMAPPVPTSKIRHQHQ